MKTNLTIRVQARGGMFLGPDSFGGAVIHIKDLKTGKNLLEGMTDNGDSGTRADAYAAGASLNTIVTPSKPKPQVNWLIAEDSTVKFQGTIEVAEPMHAEISARVPLPASQGIQVTSITQWILPGKGFTDTPGLVMEIPGLWVQPELVSDGKKVRIRAKVTMMCGCEINPDTPWLPEDFFVYYSFFHKTKDGKFGGNGELAFIDNSQFAGEVDLPTTGEYRITVNAFQNSTGNQGSASQNIRIG